MTRKYIVFLNECSLEDKLLLGGKGANLGELISAGFPVPPGFGLISSCYEHFLSANGIEARVLRQMINGTNFGDFKQVENVTSEIRDLICNGEVPEDIAQAVGEAYLTLGEDVSVAVRSSSAVTDLGLSSFPGQMDTFYFIRGIEDVLNHIKLCWASLWNARAVSNRWNKAIDHFNVKVGVIIQEMVASDISGVAFTADPVTLNKEQFVIEAVPGLGEELVSGKKTPDSFVLERETLAFVKKPESSEFSDDLIIKVAETARRIEGHFGKPQDIEWAYADENLYILQTRDIVGKAEYRVDYVGLERWNKVSEDGDETIWTRAWSDEVLTRAITPLFYSVQAELITSTYDFMYQCYGINELLPMRIMRFHKNRGYFSTKYLMKCLEYVPKSMRTDDVLKFFTPSQKEEAKSIPFRTFRKLWSEIRLLVFHHKYAFTRCYKTYYEKWLPELLRRVKELDAIDLDSADLDQIEDYFRGMDTLIKQHCEPIGLGVMIHTLTAISLLGMILKKWTGNDQEIGMLLAGIPGNRTFDANLETWRLSRKVEGSAVLKDIFSRYPSDRIVSEGDDPTLLVDVIKIFLQAGDEADPEAIEKSNIKRREEKAAEIIRTLGSQSRGFIKKGIFKFLLRYAQVYSLFRENQRYEIDRVFYGERKAFLAVSKRLLEMGLILNPDDIWFLSKEEAFDALRGEDFFRVTENLIPMPKGKWTNRRRRQRLY